MKEYDLSTKEQDHIIKQFENLLEIEHKRNIELINREREANNESRKERIDAHQKDIKRLEDKLGETEKKVGVLEIKERACAELAIAQAAKIEQLETKNNVQAQSITILQSELKQLQAASWTQKLSAK